MMTSAAMGAFAVLLTLALGACALPVSTSGPAIQPPCATTSYPDDERIGGWSVDKFAGNYTDGRNALTVYRDGHRLFVRGPILGTRQLTADNVENWTWRDGCGLRYAFMLPPDGPGGWITITMADGSTTEWRR